MKQIVLTRPSAATQKLLALQFVSTAAFGMVGPFYNLYLRNVGFSATFIGTLLSAVALLELTSTPALNNFADRYGRHRNLFIGYFIAFAIGNVIYASTDHGWLLIVGTFFAQATSRPSMVLGMQLTITKLEQQGRQTLGRVRSFSALGFGVASGVAGQFFRMGGFPLIFWGGTVLAFVSAQLGSILPEQIASKEEMTQPARRRRGFYVLLASQFFMLMGIRSGHAFLWIHFADNLGISTDNIAFLLALFAGAEVPFFVLLDPIIKRANPHIIYTIGAFGVGIAFLLFGLAPGVWWLIPTILVRGVMWPMYNVPVFMLVSQISHPRNVATNQALIQITVPSIAILLTGSVAGWTFDNLGPEVFFTAITIICSIGASIIIFGHRALVPYSEPETSIS